MKTLLFILFISLIGCTKYNSGDTVGRIKYKDHAMYGGYYYQIIEVDSVEYISNGSGGICPLIK